MKARFLISLVALCCISSQLIFAHSSVTSSQRPKKKSAAAQKPAGRPRPSAPAPNLPTPVGSQTGATEARQVNSSVVIRWRGQSGVERYRLQVARDQGFTDIVFDKAVTGFQASLEIPPGSYFWRVAPAAELEAGTYSQPEQIDVGLAAAKVASNLVIASNDTGWRTATGEVSRPVAAQLRAGKGFDIVAVSADGAVRAVETTTGLPLWTSPFAPGARRGQESGARASNFPPVVVGAQGSAYIVVAYDGGLRALRGETGRELWRAAIDGRAVSAALADVDGDSLPEIVAAFESPNSLVVLKGDNGRVVSNTKLDTPVVGAPAAFAVGSERGVLTGHADGTVVLRGANGEQMRATKLETSVTTQPVVINTTRGSFVVVGSERGLAALKADDLKLMGIIYTERDSPRGILTVADIDGDGTSEIAFVTKNGRVALVSTADGKVMWASEGASDANSVALADLNGDGIQDLIVPGGNVFALGFSGRDGTLIWKAEEEAAGRAPAARAELTPRSLAVAPLAPEGALVVGADPLRVNLRAIELPKRARTTAER